MCCFRCFHQKSLVFPYLWAVSWHFVMVAGYREHVRVLPEVLPVVVGTVLQKGWTHDEYVVKISFEILFQHFQKVVRLSTSGHADDKHVKWCFHLVLPFGQYSTPWSLFSTTLIIPSATTKMWHERSVVVASFSISRRTPAWVPISLCLLPLTLSSLTVRKSTTQANLSV